MHGFKSFANRTELNFDKSISTIIGPNGSGKSNVADALCFVLGRLSTKSIRAAKAKNLLFMGTKYVKPAREAIVELVFDNTDRAFTIDKDEVTITRIVRHSGVSIYKINDEVKTRADIIEVLAQAGIDPHGFNLILQGQIQAVVRMHPEDRRKVIEEVAGISIYESRKEKSLHELEKTDERLKEINAILRERTAFLRNLENERQQALKFKEHELTVKRCKASIIQKKIEEKQHELASINKSIQEKINQKEKLKGKADDMQKNIESLNERILQINKHIRHATGIEQETLHAHVANLKAELEGLRVRKENLEHRKAEIERRIEELSIHVPEYDKEISLLRDESPLVAKKQAELTKKKQELAKIEEERKTFYTLKTELNALKERIHDKETQVSRIAGESDSLVKQMEEQAQFLKHTDENACNKAMVEITKNIENKRKELEDFDRNALEITKRIAVYETEKTAAEKIKSQVAKLDVCPLCHNKITQDHVNHVNREADDRIGDLKNKLEIESHQIKENKKKYEELAAVLKEESKKIFEIEKELSKHQTIKDKGEYLRRLVEQEKRLQSEIKEFVHKKDILQQKTSDTTSLEERYKNILREIEEISSRTEFDVDQTLLYKERELEKMREVIKLSKKNLSEIEEEIHEFASSTEQKQALLEKKEEEETELNERFKKLFKERDDLQENIQKESYEHSTLQSEWRQVEDQINYLKVGNAKVEAEKEALEMEMRDFAGVELIKASLAVIEERLEKSKAVLQNLGSINMRALEIYDEIKLEYDKVQVKVETLQKEKEEILKIIAEIDNKKKRTFMKTFNNVNELFSSNFSRLSAKGQAFLELENPQDIFTEGVRIVIRMQKGKYFDVTSLSGGEQTLVALSLLFAIQEYKPYHFYIFDEIDAALDKRNSERLSALLKHYMKAGQYITITHNDALIMGARVLYGVSMHDGVSKILSLNVDEEKQANQEQKSMEELPKPDTQA